MATSAELACVYASLILHDDNVDITVRCLHCGPGRFMHVVRRPLPLTGCLCWKQADNIATLIKAANVTVDPYWPGLFAKLFEKTSIDDLLSNIGSGMTASPPGPHPPADLPVFRSARR